MTRLQTVKVTYTPSDFERSDILSDPKTGNALAILSNVAANESKIRINGTNRAKCLDIAVSNHK